MSGDFFMPPIPCGDHYVSGAFHMPISQCICGRAATYHTCLCRCPDCIRANEGPAPDPAVAQPRPADPAVLARLDRIAELLETLVERSR